MTTMVDGPRLVAVLERIGAVGNAIDPRLDASMVRRLYDLRCGRQSRCTLDLADRILVALDAPELLAEIAPPPSTGKRSGVWASPHPCRKLDARQVAAAHKLHMGGLSLRELGRQLWQPLGYSSAKSCAMALSTAFRREGLPRRDRIEATVAASTTHGRGARAEKAAYKRWHRATFGPWPGDTVRR